MLFNSTVFPIFFLIIYVLYWASRKRLRVQNICLLLASYFFYGWWDVRFLTLIALSTILDFYCARSIYVGLIPLKQRIKVSLFGIGSFVGFLGLDLDALTVGFRSPFVMVNWSKLLVPLTENAGYIAGLSLAILVLNAFYPLVFRLSPEARNKLFVTFSIVANLAILGIFKYFNFFADSLASLSESLWGYTPGDVTLRIVLPVGISFYTFQTMSYTIDVYRKKMPACSSFVDLAAYVSFFPQLVAGPIERGAHLLPQFQKLRTASKEGFRSGAWLILWGFFKKVVIADNLATIVNMTFDPWDTMTGDLSTPVDGVRLLVAVYAFAFQIYCDFSGYSDIARGTSKLLGFDLMLNFNLPYFSRSPSEFWQRWHISLSSWLRDYLYIPLGGNRGGAFQMYRNLTLTMILGGLWHGASWTFVLWGAYQGGILVLYRIFAPNLGRVKCKPWVAVAQWALMFQLLSIGWLIFRARNIETIWIFLKSIFTQFSFSPLAWENLHALLFYIWPLLLMQLVQLYKKELEPVHNWHWFARFNVWLFLLWGIVVLANRSSQDFIYFAF